MDSQKNIQLRKHARVVDLIACKENQSSFSLYAVDLIKDGINLFYVCIIPVPYISPQNYCAGQVLAHLFKQASQINGLTEDKPLSLLSAFALTACRKLSQFSVPSLHLKVAENRKVDFEALWGEKNFLHLFLLSVLTHNIRNTLQEGRQSNQSTWLAEGAEPGKTQRGALSIQWLVWMLNEYMVNSATYWVGLEERESIFVSLFHVMSEFDFYSEISIQRKPHNLKCTF